MLIGLEGRLQRKLTAQAWAKGEKTCCISEDWATDCPFKTDVVLGV